MLVVYSVLAAWSTLLNVVLYPSTWLHERTHYAVLAPYTTTAHHDYEASQEAASLSLRVRGVPRWRYVLGALAPTLVGLLLAAAALVVSFTATLPPAVHADLVHWLVMGAYWFTYTIPSTADVEEAATAARGDAP